MKIRYTHENGIEATTPAGDTLASFAAQVYGHCLNTDKRRAKWHTAKTFARAIADIYSINEPRTAAVIAHLESLEP